MRSLRVQLSVALLGALLAALAVVSVQTMRRADAVLTPEIERQAAAVADSAAALIGKALALGIPPDRLVGLDAYFRRVAGDNPGIAWIELRDAAGAPLYRGAARAETGEAGAEAVARLAARAENDPAHDISRAVPGAGGQAFTVTVGPDPAYASGVVAQLWLDLAIVIFVTAVVALELIYVGFGAGLYNAIEGVESRLRAIARGDLRAHSPVETGSEFGRLARRVDARLAHAHAAYAAIRDRLSQAGDKAAQQALELLRTRFGLGEAMTAASGKVLAVRAPLFVFMLAEELTRPFLPGYVKALAQPIPGLSPDFVASLPMLAFLAVVAACQPLLGGVTERVGRRRSLMLGGLAALLGYVASALADGLIGLAAARAVSGFGFAMVFVAAQGYVIDSTDPSQRSSGMATFISAILVAGVCGPPIGGILVDRVGAQGAFLIAGAFALLSLLLAWLCMPKAETRRAGPAIRWKELGRVFASPTLACLFFLCAMPAKIILVAFCFFLAPLQMDALGATQSATGRLLMIYPIVMVLLVPTFASLADRWNARAAFVAGGGVLAGASALALTFAGLGETARIAVMLLGLGLGQAISIAALSGLVGDYGRRHMEVTEGSVYGVFRLVERTGNALGPPVAGALMGLYGFQAAASIIGAGVALCALVFGISALLLRPRDLDVSHAEG